MKRRSLGNMPTREGNVGRNGIANDRDRGIGRNIISTSRASRRASINDATRRSMFPGDGGDDGDDDLATMPHHDKATSSIPQSQGNYNRNNIGTSRDTIDINNYYVNSNKNKVRFHSSNNDQVNNTTSTVIDSAVKSSINNTEDLIDESEDEDEDDTLRMDNGGGRFISPFSGQSLVFGGSYPIDAPFSARELGTGTDATTLLLGQRREKDSVSVIPEETIDEEEEEEEDSDLDEDDEVDQNLRGGRHRFCRGVDIVSGVPKVLPPSILGRGSINVNRNQRQDDVLTISRIRTYPVDEICCLPPNLCEEHALVASLSAAAASSQNIGTPKSVSESNLYEDIDTQQSMSFKSYTADSSMNKPMRSCLKETTSRNIGCDRPEINTSENSPDKAYPNERLGISGISCNDVDDTQCSSSAEIITSCHLSEQQLNICGKRATSNESLKASKQEVKLPTYINDGIRELPEQEENVKKNVIYHRLEYNVNNEHKMLNKEDYHKPHYSSWENQSGGNMKNNIQFNSKEVVLATCRQRNVELGNVATRPYIGGTTKDYYDDFDEAQEAEEDVILYGDDEEGHILQDEEGGYYDEEDCDDDDDGCDGVDFEPEEELMPSFTKCLPKNSFQHQQQRRSLPPYTDETGDTCLRRRAGEVVYQHEKHSHSASAALTFDPCDRSYHQSNQKSPKFESLSSGKRIGPPFIGSSNAATASTAAASNAAAAASSSSALRGGGRGEKGGPNEPGFAKINESKTNTNNTISKSNETSNYCNYNDVSDTVNYSDSSNSNSAACSALRNAMKACTAEELLTLNTGGGSTATSGCSSFNVPLPDIFQVLL